MARKPTSIAHHLPIQTNANSFLKQHPSSSSNWKNLTRSLARHFNAHHFNAVDLMLNPQSSLEGAIGRDAFNRIVDQFDLEKSRRHTISSSDEESTKNRNKEARELERLRALARQLNDRAQEQREAAKEALLMARETNREEFFDKAEKLIGAAEKTQRLLEEVLEEIADRLATKARPIPDDIKNDSSGPSGSRIPFALPVVFGRFDIDPLPDANSGDPGRFPEQLNLVEILDTLAPGRPNVDPLPDQVKPGTHGALTPTQYPIIQNPIGWRF